MSTKRIMIIGMALHLVVVDPVGAQNEPPVIGPAHQNLDLSRLEPFEAEYEQSGFPFRARLVRSHNVRPVWSFQMAMETPAGVRIDHVGHYADDLSFAYRKFEFRGFGAEYIDASADSSALRIRRMALGSESRSSDWSTVLTQGIFDGTFAYWLIAALPLELDYSWSMRTWSIVADSAVIRETPAFTVVGHETVTVDGSAYLCQVVSVTSRGMEFRMWVTNGAPFLIKQSAGPEGGELSPVIELKRLIATAG